MQFNSIQFISSARYLAICHPLKAQTMSQLSRAIKAILIIWFIAAICSIPLAAQLGIVYQVGDHFAHSLQPFSKFFILFFFF